MIEETKDFWGTLVEIGDLVAFPVKGFVVQIKTGKITNITHKGCEISYTDNEGQIKTSKIQSNRLFKKP